MPAEPISVRTLLGRVLACAAILAALLAASPAQAGVPKRIAERLWATVNICDTEAHPATIGIRANTMSLDRSLDLYLRFQAEFWSAAENRWRPVETGGDSGRLLAGKGRFRSLQMGYSFKLRRPTSGVFQLRGRVTFEWRRDKKLIMRTIRKTRSKKPARGGDPPGYSAAICNISATPAEPVAEAPAQ